MLSLKKIVQDIEETVELKSLVTAYEEIASMKMRKIRANVLGNRRLVTDLAEIYQQLLASYKDQILHLMEEKKIKNSRGLSLQEHNNKTACVFISANSGLFGTILKNTYKEFAEYVQKNDVEPVILGEFGKTLFTQQFPERKFAFFPIIEKGTHESATKQLSEIFMMYSNVVIFYPRFESMVSQKVALLDVSGQQKSLISDDSAHTYYYFEPSLEEILNFFEKEIFSNILSQTFIESDLAQYASRMSTLDMATQNIDNNLKIIQLQKRIALHRKLNKKQIESLTGMALWRTV